LPYNLSPEEYKDALEQIKSSASQEGRNPEDVTPSIVLTTIIDENKDECNRMLNSPLAKNELLLASYKVFQRYGISHPLGDDFRGFYDYIPTQYDKKTIVEALEKIPTQMCEDYFTSGTPEEIIDKVERYIKSGAKHIVFFDYTTTCDLTKMESSTPCLKKVVDYFKGK
jgi:phthiodiolone/phenolphthiodiolone dimycocerosates ketoreductase